MASFSEVLDEENPELFKWLTGQEYPPSRLANNLAFISLQVHVITIMNQKSHRGARAEAGHSWLRDCTCTGIFQTVVDYSTLITGRFTWCCSLKSYHLQGIPLELLKQGFKPEWQGFSDESDSDVDPEPADSSDE
eukprot:30897-Pelagococcus_subviridis.AAC.32